MKVFIVGLLMVVGGLYLGLPAEWAVGWFDEVLLVLKGVLPLGLIGMGLLTLLLGVADIRDRAEERKESKPTS